MHSSYKNNIEYDLLKVTTFDKVCIMMLGVERVWVDGKVLIIMNITFCADNIAQYMKLSKTW